MKIVDHARLRVREPERGKLDDQHGRNDREPHAAEEIRGDDDRDPEREVAAEEARVLEERADPEVRRERVVDLERRRVELRVRRPLDEADNREEHRQRHESRPERARQPRRKVHAGDDREECGEREQEEDELDAPGLEVARPDEREAAERDEGADRIRQPRSDRTRLFGDEPPAERDRRRCQDPVERDQQERVLRPQVDRNPERSGEEEGDRRERGPADECRGERDPGQHDDDQADDRHGSVEPVEVGPGDERDREHELGRGEDGEASEERAAASREKDEERADRSDDRGDLSEVSMGHVNDEA